MKIKVSDLTPRQLNYAVCAIEGKALRQSIEALHDEVVARFADGPFTMYEIVHKVKVGEQAWTVAPITVTGIGRQEAPEARCIRFISQGKPCLGSASNYFFTEEEARNEALIWSVGMYTDYSFDTDPSAAHPIIEREGIGFFCNRTAEVGARFNPDAGADWRAFAFNKHGTHYFGPTAIIAAMRCYVAAKLGDEVEIPEGV